MPAEQQGSPIASLTPEERAAFRQVVSELQQRRNAASILAVPAREVVEPHIAGATPPVRGALRHLIERDERGPAYAETAPDFSLKQLGTDQRISLSQFRGSRPVALVFGSYT